ncbi:hypothetical protein LCGC14_2885580 [marine sediment metagenome]|uniref:Uncharacterized protein n=1 Tax=marine sediment metagenome TaxID=412755 RepID=A0A0F8XYT1_9ZZZZ
MFVVVDRKGQTVRVEGLTANEAGWLGYKFVKDFPHLVDRDTKWYVVVFDAVPDRYSRAETYNVAADWHTAARRVAEIIKTPPPPAHTCPDCKCKPECCKGE